MPFNEPPDLNEDGAALAALAARHCQLPYPSVVAKFDGAVFPTIRDQKKRLSVDHERRLLLDDNVTPRWALFWAHGLAQTHHPRGWTIAHVWAAPKDPAAYTHLANLCLMPESLGSLSDKRGPLCAFLQFHAYHVYGWHPAHVAPPSRPEGYGQIEWRYFAEYSDPLGFIRDRVMSLGNQRVSALRPLMGLADG